MVAAEEHRHLAVLGHRIGRVVQRPRPAGDLAEEAAAAGERRRHRHLGRRRRGEIAGVAHPVAELAERAGDPGSPERVRPHQRAARGGAELESDAEQPQVAGRRRYGHRSSLRLVEHIVTICGIGVACQV